MLLVLGGGFVLQNTTPNASPCSACCTEFEKGCFRILNYSTRHVTCSSAQLSPAQTSSAQLGSAQLILFGPFHGPEGAFLEPPFGGRGRRQAATAEPRFFRIDDFRMNAFKPNDRLNWARI